MSTAVQDTISYLVKRAEEEILSHVDPDVVQMTYRMPRDLRFKLDIASKWLGITRTGLMNLLLEAALSDAIDKIELDGWQINGKTIKEQMGVTGDPAQCVTEVQKGDVIVEEEAA